MRTFARYLKWCVPTCTRCTRRAFDYFEEGLSLPQVSIDRWIAHWSTMGLRAIEGLIGDEGYCVVELRWPMSSSYPRSMPLAASMSTLGHSRRSGRSRSDAIG